MASRSTASVARSSAASRSNCMVRVAFKGVWLRTAPATASRRFGKAGDQQQRTKQRSSGKDRLRKGTKGTTQRGHRRKREAWGGERSSGRRKQGQRAERRGGKEGGRTLHTQFETET